MSALLDGPPVLTLEIVLSNALVQQLGLSEEEFAIFIELELAPFSIMVHCRRYAVNLGTALLPRCLLSHHMPAVRIPSSLRKQIWTR